ncbi:MAG: sugar transferase [Terriglobia bacterium]|jgi:lipopolysaccharide/colanic/teichoic acid biosynthesis glycosyltransferase
MPFEGKPVQRAVKRILDLVVSLVAGVMLLPVFALIALLIRLDSDGPIFFVSDRVGRGGQIFRLFKFRSMVAGAHDMLKDLAHLNEGGRYMIKIPNDPRITRIGGVLRKYSLDELPQLWNVIRGDMSLVGPRPQAPNEVALYTIEQRKRLDVPAGITGLWQVTARTTPSFEVWVAKDIEYIENWSLWLDLRIMIKTIKVVALGMTYSARAHASKM